MTLHVTRNRRHRGDVRPGHLESAAKAGAQAHQRPPVLTRERRHAADRLAPLTQSGEVGKLRIGGLSDSDFAVWKNRNPSSRY